MNRVIIASVIMILSSGIQADQRIRPDVEVYIPPEIFNSDDVNMQNCLQCCVYQGQNYSEGAVIRVEGLLLQCKRNESTISTNPLVWRHVKG